MRISRDKSVSDPIQITPDHIQSSTEGRKRELALLIQAALKVGANLAAREAGRRAYAEFVKLDRDLQSSPTVSVADEGQLVFADVKRRRGRAVL